MGTRKCSFNTNSCRSFCRHPYRYWRRVDPSVPRFCRGIGYSLGHSFKTFFHIDWENVSIHQRRHPGGNKLFIFPGNRSLFIHLYLYNHTHDGTCHHGNQQAQGCSHYFGSVGKIQKTSCTGWAGVSHYSMVRVDIAARLKDPLCRG